MPYFIINSILTFHVKMSNNIQKILGEFLLKHNIIFYFFSLINY